MRSHEKAAKKEAPPGLDCGRTTRAELQAKPKPGRSVRRSSIYLVSSAGYRRRSSVVASHAVLLVPSVTMVLPTSR